MSKREAGTYWIKQDPDGNWEVAEYGGGYWYITGSEIGYEEDEDSWCPITIHSARRIREPVG